MKSLNERFDKKKNKVKKKHLARVLERASSQLASLPRQCSTCSLEFDPKVPDAINTWHVTLSPTSTTLACPECFAKRDMHSTTDGAEEKV